MAHRLPPWSNFDAKTAAICGPVIPFRAEGNIAEADEGTVEQDCVSSSVALTSQSNARGSDLVPHVCGTTNVTAQTFWSAETSVGREDNVRTMFGSASKADFAHPERRRPFRVSRQPASIVCTWILFCRAGGW